MVYDNVGDAFKKNEGDYTDSNYARDQRNLRFSRENSYNYNNSEVLNAPSLNPADEEERMMN